MRKSQADSNSALALTLFKNIKYRKSCRRIVLDESLGGYQRWKSGGNLTLKCCSVQHKLDGIYYISHPQKGTTKVIYAKCHKCKGLVLNIFYGLFANKSENLSGKEAKEFNRKFPENININELKKIEEENKNAGSNPVIDISGSWAFGKTIEKAHPEGKIEFIHRSYYYNSGRKRKDEPSTFKTNISA